ncbi:putative RNA-directed DNA polymerase [Lupinus albus]|uniref:Telomerase reverse transcriptase n=1 Tax=Lupinus albus TaxID=3870 RepID=A0A6A4PHA0_LUPAL|nr:putative RNA-directed DNA polymerase [Lupinus albus]
MGKKRKLHRPVPDVLWRLFHHRARTLSHTILSILPSPPPSPQLCRCIGRCCLRCTTDRTSFLLRSDDPSDYQTLLTKCFLVVAQNAPSLTLFTPYSNFPQNQIVKKTIEQMLSTREPVYSNVLYSGYDKKKSSSPIVELLSSASWCLLLSRVGDDLMVYLLRNTSIFLPAPHGKHHQVGGPPINHLCFNMLKCSSKSGNQNPSLDKCGGQKRKRDGADDLTTERQKCHISYCTNDPGDFVSSLGLTGKKSSLQLISHHGRSNYDISVSEVPKSTRTDAVVQKSESEGKQDSVCFTPRLGKRSRPFRWQRQRFKKRQLNFEENSLNILPINTDGLHGSFQCDNTSLSIHEKLPWQCSCCLILQSLPTVPKKTNIKRQAIFYNLEPSFSVLPKKHILYSLRPNLACSKYLLGNIFGFSDVNPTAQSMHCFHNSGSCLIGSACLVCEVHFTQKARMYVKFILLYGSWISLAEILGFCKMRLYRVP